MAYIMKPMDPELANAARSGDTEFLRKAVAKCQAANDDYSYFLSEITSSEAEGGKVGNIFHLAASNNQDGFFGEAIKSLPIQVLQFLLSQQIRRTGWRPSQMNPLHVAVHVGNVRIVKRIIDFYRTSVDSSGSTHSICKPWLAQQSSGRTPLHHALTKDTIELALELLSVDMELLCKMEDNNGNGPLYLAVRKGFTPVALMILNSGHAYSIRGKLGLTPLHYVPYCSEEVCRRLLERHPELLKVRGHQGATIMHKWVRAGKVWPFEFLLNSKDVAPEWRRDFVELMCAADDYGENPLHHNARDDSNEAHKIAKMLVDAYVQERGEESSCLLEGQVPWLRQNGKGKTPLDLAVKDIEKRRKVVLCFLSPEISSVLKGPDNIFFFAIENDEHQIAERILALLNEHGWGTSLTSGRGRNVLHDASKYKKEVATWLVNKCPLSFISGQDEEGKTPLHEASEAGAAWLVELMLKLNPSSLVEASSSKAPLPWVEACKRGCLSVVRLFIKSPYFRDVCLEHHDTPLHHINLNGYTSYKDFLKIPIINELRYKKDSDGATPLHRAIMNDNMALAEVLLNSRGPDWRAKDDSGKTPMDLLAVKCTQNQKWADICKRMGINPELKMTYVQQETNLLDMRSTLSVVAALLATITFTAGFTLPGGFDNNNGEAILAKKAAFLVFLISDTYAMCCSMLVLFCLIWSMVSDRNKSLLLIDRSMVILLQSLYGTLVAFMTGVFTVIFQRSLWAAILIIVMCSLVAISATVRIILFNIIDKLVPASDEHGFPHRLKQLGNACTCCGRTGTASPTDPVSNV